MATTAELRFNQWYETDGIDAGRVLVSNDNGTTFYLVRPTSGYSSTAIFNPAEGYTGTSGGWMSASIDLTPFAGTRIIVVFDFKADGATERKVRSSRSQ